MTILINVDVNKITKSRITERKYKNKEGVEVTVKDLKLAVVPLREAKVIKFGAGWVMEKTHFVTEAPTKEEKDDKVKMPIIGDGIQFRSDDADTDATHFQAPAPRPEKVYKDGEDPDKIPF